MLQREYFMVPLRLIHINKKEEIFIRILFEKKFKHSINYQDLENVMYGGF